MTSKRKRSDIGTYQRQNLRQKISNINDNLDNPKDLHILSRSDEIDHQYLEIYTDGACSFNGSPEAIAGIGVHFSNFCNMFTDISERFVDGRILVTNNRAELYAVVRALEEVVKTLASNITLRFTNITIFTDSDYIIRIFVRKNRRNKNRDLLSRVDSLATHLQIIHDISIMYTHVKAHSGIEGNDIADSLAVEGKYKDY